MTTKTAIQPETNILLEISLVLFVSIAPLSDVDALPHSLSRDAVYVCGLKFVREIV